MSATAMTDLANDLEAAADRALKGGASEAEVIRMFAKFVGYSLANGSPSLEGTNSALRLATITMRVTAGEVFAKTSPLHHTVGNA